LTATPSPSASGTGSEPAAAPAARPTLLIVDDEEGPRQSLKIVFKNDYHVLTATNGVDAIQLARTQSIDVAVLDIMMMGMSGVELLRELKAIDPTIEVVMLTAFETIETARQALRHGASDYLNKPFDIQSIREAVSRAAQKHTSALDFAKSNDQLQRLRSEIQDQSVREEMARTKGEIYASVLHDLNGPLTVISGFIEIINRSIHNTARVEGPQLESIRDDLGKLTNQIGRCFDISRRYLGFLHSAPQEKMTVGVNQILDDLRELLIRHPSARGNQLTVHRLEHDLIADINGTDFLQILLNLTINALQATENPHRVDVHCAVHPNPLDLTAYTDGPGERFINREEFANRPPLLAISIIDDGPGIPPAELAKMFEERFTTKAPDRGTGLGLSIVKRLVREARGAIMIRTQVGKGSTFTVLLQTQAA
jgi:two-component system, sensor histidine kinase and response regulator